MSDTILRLSEFSPTGAVTHGFSTRDGAAEIAAKTNVVLVNQVHGKTVCRLDALPPAGAPRPEADALVTNQPGIALAMQTADCLPVLFLDPRQRAIAAAHAGWRGLAHGVLQETIAAMASAYGTRASDLQIAIGPAIGACCFQVGADVIEAFGEKRIAPFARSTGPQHWHVDLADLAVFILQAEGVAAIYRLNECTFCRSDRYVSYRRNRGETGRQLSFIELRDTIK